MATTGSATSLRDPGRPYPFSIEHILSSLPERRPVARPQQPVGDRNPAEPDEPEAPAATAPCTCCCCCNPRASPRGVPEAASTPGECERRNEASAGISQGGRWGELGSHPNPMSDRALAPPRPAGVRLAWPLRLAPAAPLPLTAPSAGSPALTGTSGQGPQRRTRRHRTIFSEEQLQALEALFVQNQYPDVGTRERLAVRIRLREERVEVGVCPAAGRPTLAPHFSFKDRPGWGSSQSSPRWRAPGSVDGSTGPVPVSCFWECRRNRKALRVFFSDFVCLPRFPY